MPRKRTPSKKHSNGIYMPRKKTAVKSTKRRKKNIFKSKQTNKRRKRTPDRKNITNILILLVSVAILAGLLYISIKYILQLRNTETVYEETYVVGLQDIPAYPNSEFIFKDNLSDTSISNFLSQENSAYRLPSHTGISDVFEFYQEQLPNKGWTHVLSVPVKSDDKEYGEYWIKENNGLRIYSKYNDIWYESISKEDAETGLANQVKEEIERDMLLASSNMQEFLPDYPWILNIPKEYLVSYTSSEMGSLRTANIKKVDGSELTTVVPIGYSGAKALDFFLEDYINSFENGNAGINNTVIIPKPGIQGTIRVNGNTHLVAVISNNYNDVVYVIDCNKTESPFFEYLVENITSQSSEKY